MNTPTSSFAPYRSEDAYELLLAAIRERFTETTKDEHVQLFDVDAGALYDVMLEALPSSLRQTHACATCRKFVAHWGALATLTAEGELVSVLWDRASDVPVYGPAVAALARAVERGRVIGPVVTQREQWGIAEKGPFRHFAVLPPAHVLARGSVVETADQIAARKRHEYAILQHSLAEYPLELVRKAHSLLTTGALYRSEKCIGVAAWLVALQERCEAVRDTRRREHLVWAASAVAPPGFAHVRSGMIGTLLDDLAAGYPFETVKARFDAKMHPLQYMRPTAAPSAGNVAQAEKIIAALRAEGALERRFARLEDLQTLWTPAQKPERERKGVFGHLLARDDDRGTPTGVPAITMTWEKFARTVLPNAVRIELAIPQGAHSFAAFVTAVHPEAAPILQWDRPERRNPVSWYLYVNGTEAKRWNLTAGSDVVVTAITAQPSAWYRETDHAHHGDAVMFVLTGARDTGYKNGAGFFPESLKAELHPIRKTIEAYAKDAIVVGAAEATACGLMLSKGAQWNHLVHVVGRDGMRNSYRLDRWD